jgi:hypothetical protein
MTTLDLLVKRRGVQEDTIYTLIHIYDNDECLIACLPSEGKPGEIVRATYQSLEPVGFNPLTTRDLQSIPRKGRVQIFIVGQEDNVDAETAGLYRFKTGEEDKALKAYKEDYKRDGSILAVMDDNGEVRCNPKLSEQAERVIMVVDQLIAKLKGALKE